MTRREKYRATQKRRRDYCTRRALKLIRRGQPKTVDEALALGLGPLIEAGTGAFRHTYRIRETNLLIKFPLKYSYPNGNGGKTWHSNEGKNHSRMEVKKIRALLKFPMWRKHLPPIYYFNSRDGVIVTKYYRPRKKSLYFAERNILVRNLVKEFCGVILGDLTDDNVRVDDNLVIIDLGY